MLHYNRINTLLKKNFEHIIQYPVIIILLQIAMHPPSIENEQGVSEVCLAGQDLRELCLVEYGSFIRKIDLSFNILVSLRGLHICSDTLEELILDNNLLERVDFRAEFPKLHTLSLNKNRITDLDILLQELSRRVKNLRHLSLLGNPVCPDQLTCDLVEEKDYEIYRCHILFHLRNVRFLDHRPVPLPELKESRKRIYDHVKIVPSYTPLVSPSPLMPIISSSPRSISISVLTQRSSSSTSGSSSNASNSPTSFHQQNQDPNSMSNVSQMLRGDLPKGRTGKRRFRYVGKNSEGNRFIQDNDL